MTISPFALYLILQLDSIKQGLEALIVGMFIVTIATLLVAVFRCDFKREEKQKEIWAQHMPYVKGCAAVMLLSLVTNTLVPSTKSMAAIVVVPAIVNNETVQQEAGELYDLAKQALAKAVATEPKPPVEEQQATQ